MGNAVMNYLIIIMNIIMDIINYGFSNHFYAIPTRYSVEILYVPISNRYTCTDTYVPSYNYLHSYTTTIK
jgi:hypothetical protein